VIELETQRELEQFFKGIERRAYRMAEYATGSRDDALDLVQEAMMVLVRRYAGRPPEEWGALFHRVLQNQIRDWYRRSKVRNRFRSWLGLGRSSDGEGPVEDPLEQIADPRDPDPATELKREETLVELEQAVRELPLRQQQAFLLRSWEGFSVAESAAAMGCSAGSVKTHYSRALQTLRNRLESYR